MSSPILSIERLGGGYGKLAVFRDAELTLAPGQVLGILGPNGAGKTTLLKTIAGLLPAQSGAIRFLGRDVAGLRAVDRTRLGLALVPEGRQIITSLSVADNLALSRAAGRLDRAAFAVRHAEVLALFPRLGERLGQPGGALSGGEQQMLAIGRALLLDPALLMLDEPTQGLAPIMVRQVQLALQSLAGRLPLLVVEQNRAFLDGLTDRVLVMKGGVLAAA
jgi:branched-chain amino acid transport system ATP-binding protein